MIAPWSESMQKRQTYASKRLTQNWSSIKILQLLQQTEEEGLARQVIRPDRVDLFQWYMPLNYDRNVQFRRTPKVIFPTLQYNRVFPIVRYAPLQAHQDSSAMEHYQ